MTAIGAFQSLQTLGGWSAGFPATIDGSRSQVEIETAARWVALNNNPGIQVFSTAAMWEQFKTPNQYKAEGVQVTEQNYRNLARFESARLYALGFTQVHEPQFAQRIFTSFRTAIEGTTPQDVRDQIGADSAERATERALEQTQWRYIFSESVDELGEVVRETGGVVKQGVNIAENLSNPIALSSLAILAVVGVGLFVASKVT